MPLAAQRRVDSGGRGRVEVAQPPRLGLWIMTSAKVGDQLIIQEVPQAGTVICNAVGLAWEVEYDMLLIVEHTLVHHLESQQVGGRPSVQGRPLH